MGISEMQTAESIFYDVNTTVSKPLYKIMIN